MRAMKNYRELYEGVAGACASCRHITSKQPGLDGDYIKYDGSKCGYCAQKGAIASIVIHDTPDMRFPVNECWEPIIAE